MGQKANLLTTRYPGAYTLSSHNTKTWVSLQKLVENINRLFLLKGAWVVKNYFGFENNCVFVDFALFFQAKLIAKYKKKIKSIRYLVPAIHKKYYSSLFRKCAAELGYSLYVLKINKVNSLLYPQRRRAVKYAYNKFKKFLWTIFSRRFNLFLDFVKSYCLLRDHMLSGGFFTHILGLIFKSLSKRSHSRYIAFIRFVIHTILKPKRSAPLIGVRGVKFLLCGRLAGKQRASSRLIQMGQVPIQTIDKNIVFSKVHIYTLYGVFGLKTWIFLRAI